MIVPPRPAISSVRRLISSERRATGVSWASKSLSSTPSRLLEHSSRRNLHDGFFRDGVLNIIKTRGRRVPMSTPSCSLVPMPSFYLAYVLDSTTLNWKPSKASTNVLLPSLCIPITTSWGAVKSMEKLHEEVNRIFLSGSHHIFTLTPLKRLEDR